MYYLKYILRHINCLSTNNFRRRSLAMPGLNNFRITILIMNNLFWDYCLIFYLRSYFTFTNSKLYIILLVNNNIPYRSIFWFAFCFGFLGYCCHRFFWSIFHVHFQFDYLNLEPLFMNIGSLRLRSFSFNLFHRFIKWNNTYFYLATTFIICLTLEI